MGESKVEEALRMFPLPVSVVTVGRGAVENALTISWASPVSFEPLQFMIAVDKKHYSVEFLESTKNFVINLLKADQRKLAGHFAKRSYTGKGKLDEVATREASTGGAILTDALAYFDCEVVAKYEVGDHNLYIGRVVEAGVLGEGEPLTTSAGIRYVKSKPS